MHDLLTIRDLIVGPVILILILFYSLKWAKNRYQDSELYVHFKYGLFLRMAGAILSALIYHFYYGGDTVRFMNAISLFTEAFQYHTEIFTDLILHNSSSYSEETLNYLYAYLPVDSYFDVFKGGTELILIRLGSLFNLLAFDSYLALSFFFSLFSFIGSWGIFRVFTDLYPKAIKLFAFATLYLPSIWFWGTGVLKDPLALGFLGVLFYATYRIGSKRQFSFTYLLLIAVSAFFLLNLKAYILLSVLPAIFIWLFSKWIARLPAQFRVLTFPVLFGFFLGSMLLALSVLAGMNRKYAMDNLLHTAVETNEWITHVSRQQGGSVYNLGSFDASLVSMLPIFPNAVIVTLYRPWLWEVRNPFMLMSALESLLSLIATFYMIYLYKGPINLGKQLFRNKEALFCLTFVLIFAFGVGLTSGNFGALARYKVPGYQFYFILLVILYMNAPRVQGRKPVHALGVKMQIKRRQLLSKESI